MVEKKEIQETILKQNDVKSNNKPTEEELLNLLRLVAPGTNFRTALNGALKIGKGALVAVENPKILQIIDGGFRINARFTPQRFMELTKMDGAIILSKDMKKINYANVMLAPDNKLKSVETGTRHKAAERTAKQTGTLVIAISERKNEITLYYRNTRYPILPTDELLQKANNYLQIIEKQRELFDMHVEKLTRLELRNHQSLSQSVAAMQKGILIQKIAENLQKSIIELGNEGTLLKARLREITHDVEKETDLIIKDYTNINLKKTKDILESTPYENIEKEQILSALGFENNQKIEAIMGWRILSKTSLSESEIACLVKEMGSLGAVVHSNISTYKNLLGSEQARVFNEEISKIKIGS